MDWRAKTADGSWACELDIRSLSACATTRILEAWSRSKPASPHNFLLARHWGAVPARADEPSLALRPSLTLLTCVGRRSAHFRMASSAGQRDWPHDVRLYSTLGGTCG